MGEAWSNQLVSLIILSLPGGYTGLFGYQPAPGPGNLVISITAQAGTDPFGNPYPAGIQVGPASGPQVEITGGNPATVSFPINDPAITSQPVLFGFETTPGPAQWAGLAVQGAGINLAGHRDIVSIGMNSPSKDGSSSANGEIDFRNDAGAGTIMAVWDNNGFAIRRCPQITATDPSVVATSVSPAIAETWHDMRPLSNSFVGTIAGRYPPQYRKVADGTIQIAGFIQCPNAANPNSITFANLPAAYRPTANSGEKWVVGMETSVVPVAIPFCQIDTSGNLQLHNFPATSMNNNIIPIGGMYPLDNTGMILS